MTSFDTIQPCYVHETLTIGAVRQLIWQEARGNLYLIVICKANINYEDNGSLYQYSKLLNEVRRLNKQGERYRAERELHLNKFVNFYQ